MNLLKKIGMPLAVVAGLGLNGCRGGIKTIETIGDLKVDYNEKLFFNQMDVAKEDTTFKFFDIDGDDYIDWESDTPLKEAVLEQAGVYVGDKISTYVSSQINENTLTGRINKAAFERFNPWYNELRAAIRDSLRDGYKRDSMGVNLQ